VLVILLRFKKLDQPELVKSALKNAAIKKGKLGEVGSNFVRWEWTYAFAKPKAEEVAKLVEAYPLHKAGIESLYAVPETRYEVPGLIFSADPPFTDWH